MGEIKIALTGLLRSGKDSVGDYALQQHNLINFAFGAELKKDFHRMYKGVPVKPKPRKGYQLHGQLMRYVHGEDYWINKLEDYINHMRYSSQGYRSIESDYCGFHQQGVSHIITDLRQPNELEWCKQQGYTVIKVHCDEDVRLKRLKESDDRYDPEDLGHETESLIGKLTVDFVIDNSFDLNNTYTQFDSIMTVIKAREIESFTS